MWGLGLVSVGTWPGECGDLNNISWSDAHLPEYALSAEDLAGDELAVSLNVGRD